MKKLWLYKIVRPFITFLFKLIYHPKIIGSEFIPKKDGIVLAGNHTNNLDCLLLISSTKRNIHFLAKDSLCKGVKKYIFLNMGIIPVDRSKRNKEVMEAARNVLNNNGVIGIFPEGTINRTEDIIRPFKMGAVKMAYDTAKCIVPFAITGKYKPFINDLKIVFSKPYKINNDLIKENKLLSNKVTELLRRK